MKKAIIICLALVSLIACDKETPQQTAVRQYISTKIGWTDYTITHMSALDSVFTPLNINLSASYFINRLAADINYHRRTLSDTWATRQEIANARDSIKLLQVQLDSIQTIKQQLIEEKKPNRLGIVVNLTRNNIPHCFTFVFNPDGNTISHYLDDFGNIIK